MGVRSRSAWQPTRTFFVAASGDGEVSLLADYSPFAIAEFRDWLRGAGLYAAGQPFAGEAYVNAARYGGDAAPADLNADFGTAFDTWNLRHFDWLLTNATGPDPNAIPSSTYDQPGWPALAVANPAGFDAPRGRRPADAWWQVWDRFRQTMVWRYNRQFAKCRRLFRFRYDRASQRVCTQSHGASPTAAATRKALAAATLQSRTPELGRPGRA